MNLKSELDKIYDQVYMVRESMSSEDSAIFLAGFEDGINEGIGKWLGKAAGWISDIPNKVKKSARYIADKTRDLYNRGKEWASKAIDKLKNWMSDAYDKVKTWMSDAGKWISEKFEVFVQKVKDAFSAMGKKLVELWEATKEKSKAFWEATKSFFSRMTESIKKGYASAKEWLIKMGGNISEWAKKSWEKLKDLAGRAKDKMTELYLKAIEALKKGGAAVKKWIGIVALYLIIKPTEKIKEWLKKIPELYDRYSKIISEFIDRQVQDFKLGFEEGSGRPWDRAKGFINKSSFPEVSVSPIDPEKEAEEEAKISRAIRYDDPMIDKQSGLDSALGAKLKDKNAAQSEVEDAAEALVSNPRFKNRYMKYSDSDLRATLRNDGLTPLAIDWISAWVEEEKSKKKVMALPEKFRYLKTFEAFTK